MQCQKYIHNKYGIQLKKNYTLLVLSKEDSVVALRVFSFGLISSCDCGMLATQHRPFKK